jgi:hypothetical protein
MSNVLDETPTGLVVQDAIDVDQSLAVGLTRAEVDQQIATAQKFPRSLGKVASMVHNYVTLDLESAAECTYALPRDGKAITGPSIRFAEILKACYGNCRAAARVVHVDRIEKYVEAEGIFHDLENNTATSARVRRRISGKNGKVFSDDMILVTGNAASSIALRNAILGGIPKPLWRRAFEAAQDAAHGDIQTLAVNRDKALKYFARFGVTPDQVFAALGLNGVEDIMVEHIGTMRGMCEALKNNEATVEEMFVTVTKGSGVAGGGRLQPGNNPLNDEVADPNTGELPPKEEKKPTKAKAEAKPKAETANPNLDRQPKAEEKPAEQQQDQQQEAAGTTAPDAPSDAETAGQAEDAPADDRQQPSNAQATDMFGEPAAPTHGCTPAEIKDLRQYASTMFRAEDASQLNTFHNSFWKQAGRTLPADGTRAQAVLNSLYDLHVDRLAKGSARPAVEGMIEEILA